MKKIIVLFAMIFTIVPFNLIIDINYRIQGLSVIYLVSLFIGYILFFINYRKYTKFQKKILLIALVMLAIHILSGGMHVALDLNLNGWKTNTMSDLGPYMIDAIFTYITYFSLRICCFIAGMSILITKKTTNKF